MEIEAWDRDIFLCFSRPDRSGDSIILTGTWSARPDGSIMVSLSNGANTFGFAVPARALPTTGCGVANMVSGIHTLLTTGEEPQELHRRVELPLWQVAD